MIFLIIAVVAMFIEVNRWAPQYYRTNEAQPTVMVVPTDDLVTYKIV